MNKIKPISPSEYWVWKNKKEEYYKKYVLGQDDFEVNDKMKFGIAVHKAFEGVDWQNYAKEELQEKDIEMIKIILNNDIPDIPEKEVWLGEYGKEYTEIGCKLSGRADGLDVPNDILYEIKTSDYHWSQWLADRNHALTHYSFLYYDMHGELPKIKIISCSRKKGTVKIIDTQRHWGHIQPYLADLREMVKQLKKNNWFHLRKSTYNSRQD